LINNNLTTINVISAMGYFFSPHLDCLFSNVEVVSFDQIHLCALSRKTIRDIIFTSPYLIWTDKINTAG